NYLDYVADVDENRWLGRYIAEGKDEIAEALSVKNTVPNVSAVVFDRASMIRALDSAGNLASHFRVAGGWRGYIEVLAHRRMGFCPRTANLHRRHQRSVTNIGLNIGQLIEIVRMQALVASRYNVSAEKRAEARRYAETIYAQVSAGDTETPSIEQI